MQFPFITYGIALYRQYNDKILTLLMRASGASELRIFFSIFTFYNCYFLLYSVGTSDTLSQKHIYFQVSNYTCRQFPFITYGMTLHKRYTTDKSTLWKSMFMRASGASEVENFDILHTKSAIFLPIFCRYFRYFVGTNYMLMVWRYI